MLRLKNVTKVYRTSEVETHALNDVSLEGIGREFVAIMGPSDAASQRSSTSWGCSTAQTAGSTGSSAGCGALLGTGTDAIAAWRRRLHFSKLQLDR